ncbi:hypothetical protein EB796_012458 [Bugula neritina]|uniref:Uncharacterized protein n=1 Tax=Bugula neritina TaxID=10212 RepID=A0A7J7JUA8_BUGNE|nr:hypothetical protein EB796_012458 [Bugula neritina]
MSEILLPYNVSDYTKAYTREWFWSRLEGSLSAPTNSSGGYEGPAGKLGKADSLRDENVSAVSSCSSSRSSSSVHLPTQESIHRESRRDESRVSAATGSDQDTLERSSSGCSSLSGPSSVFYVPLPNNSKRKVKYKWDKTSASYTT